MDTHIEHPDAEGLRELLHQGLLSGKSALQADFTPSAALALSGITISLVRAKFGGVGEIVKVLPALPPSLEYAFHDRSLLLRDVDADPELFTLYDFRVPVVLVEGRVVGEGKIKPETLSRALSR